MDTGAGKGCGDSRCTDWNARRNSKLWDNIGPDAREAKKKREAEEADVILFVDKKPIPNDAVLTMSVVKNRVIRGDKSYKLQDIANSALGMHKTVTGDGVADRVEELKSYCSQ